MVRVLATHVRASLIPSYSSIIDFELWYETNSLNFKEPKELYRWGLAEMPMPTSFFEAWAMHNRDGRF